MKEKIQEQKIIQVLQAIESTAGQLKTESKHHDKVLINEEPRLQPTLWPSRKPHGNEDTRSNSTKTPNRGP